MAKTFRQPDLNLRATSSVAPIEAVRLPGWRQQLPRLTGRHLTLREVEPGDAQALLAMLTTDEVTRFISPPPTTVEGFGRFIDWALRERRDGRYICFAVVPHELKAAVGIFQVREMEPSFQTAEWGFALASPFWGSGAFVEAARLVLDFTFDTVGAHRVEARAVIQNGRGNGALRKLGATQEGLLRRSFLRRGEYLDQHLWAILADEWRRHALGERHVH
jgi:RimJ/RimL family protein N-acetyltransferase